MDNQKTLDILVCDDDECDRLAVQRAVDGMAGEIRVSPVTSYEEAWKALKGRTFDCALVDYLMPDGDGLSLLDAARQARLATPIVLMTGVGDELIAAEAIRRGAVAYLPKSLLGTERLAVCLEEVEQQRAERLAVVLRQRRMRKLQTMAQAVDRSVESVMITDPKGRIQYVNPAFTALTGLSGREVLGKTPAVLKGGATPPETYRELWSTVTAGRTWSGELVNRRADGTTFVASVSIAPMNAPDGTLKGYVANHRDVSREKSEVESLRHLADTDGLTGLCNRRCLIERLGSELERALRYRRSLCLLLVDLDHFKQVNDRFGHLAGDRVLAKSAAVLRSLTRAADTAGRYGGEEFALVLPETRLPRARVLAKRIRAGLAQQPHRDEHGYPFTVTCSIGIAELGRHSTVESLIQSADRALYEAKSAGRNCVVVARQ